MPSTEQLDWYYPDGTIITLANLPTWSWNGATTAAQELWLINNKDGTGADDAVDCRLNPLVKVFGTPATTPHLASGREIVDRRFVEVRIVGGYNQTLAATEWRRVGGTSQMPVPRLPNDRGIKVEVRINGTSDATNDHVQVLLQVAGPTGVALGFGHTEALPDGVVLGLGDGARTVLLKAGNVVENPGGADEFVQLQEMEGLAAGVPWSIVQQLVEITDEDANTDALLAGEAYYSLLTVDGTGTVVQVKGAKATAPLDDGDEPALPDGSEAVALVLREFDGVINAADITNRWQLGALGWSDTGLNFTIGPGAARTDNTYEERTGTRSGSLTASSTNRVWHQAGGTLEVTTTAARPTGSPRAQLLYEATTDGSGVTTLTDRRGWLGHQEEHLEMQFAAALAGGQFAYAGGVVGPRDFYLLPLAPVLVWLRDLGSGMSGGAYLFDLSYAAPTGVTWVTLYTSSGTRDLRPSIAWDATSPLDSDSQPDVRVIPAYSQVRATVVSIATGGGTAPAGAVVLLRGARS